MGSGVCLGLCVTEVNAQSTARPAVWDKPSEADQQQVSQWAAQEFAKPASVTNANPIRDQKPSKPAPLTLNAPSTLSNPASPIQPVSTTGRYGELAAKDNPLRFESQPTSDPAAARKAFADSKLEPVVPPQGGGSSNPFVRLDSPPAGESATSTDAKNAFSDSKPTIKPKQKEIAANEPEIRIEEPRPFVIPQQEERSIIASRSSVNEPKIDPIRPAVLEPSTNLQPIEPSFGNLSANSRGTSSEGTGRPGSRELQGAQRASLVIEKKAPAEARIGQPCRFVLKVRNTGNRPAENVVLRDETPSGARLVETIPLAQQQGSNLSWKLGSLAPGQERSVEIHVEPINEGQIGSVATVSFDAQASAVTKCTRPQIALRLSAPGKVLVGQKQPLRIEVHNPGTGVATGVMLVEDVPSNLRHEAGPELEFEVGSLSPGETRQLDLMLTAEEAGHVVNQLTAVADGGLRVEQSIEFDVVAPSLSVDVAGPQRRYLERPASYTVSIGNPGTAPAKDVRLVTKLPRGMKFVRANNLGEYDSQTHSVYWSLAELPEGERGEVQLVALPVAAGEQTLVVEGAAESGLKASESQRVLVEGVASLAFDVRDLQDPIEVGSHAAYDVVVTNEGTQAAANVRVVFQAPPGMQVVEAKGQTQHQMGQDRVEFAPIPTLEPGVKARFAVRMLGQRSGDQRIAVEVSSDELTQPIRREESTRVFGDE